MRTASTEAETIQQNGHSLQNQDLGAIYGSMMIYVLWSYDRKPLIYQQCIL